MPRLVPNRLAAVCVLALMFLVSTTALAVGKGTRADLRVVGSGGKVLTEQTLQTSTTKVPTSPKATCLGKGTGGSGKAVSVKGPTPIGLLAQAAKETSSLKPLLITDAFDFGLGICGVGGYSATRQESWYLKVNHKNPGLSGDAVKLKKDDEVLWALAGFPYPNELSLVAPAEAQAGVPFEVTVYSYNDKGKRKPASGATLTGAAGPTGADGRATVTVTGPSTLVARHGKDIPSNGVAVCVAGVCPLG